LNTSYSTTSTAAGTGSTGNSETGITYDNMGNLLTLNRTGGTNAASLTYDGYNGTQLTSVKNAGASFRTYGTYDANGNAPSDGNGNTINYNLLNLPVSIPGKSLTYTYDAAGAKLRKVSGPTTTEYIDGIQYTGTTMDFVQTEEGRILNPTGTPNYEYTLTDHLGNSRVSFDSSHGGSTALQTEDYYPFGLIASQPYVTSPPNHYLYNRKELQDELTQYDYGARFYDPVIGRWTSVDPLAEKYCAVSGYNYGINNPVRFHDPNGMGPNDWVKIGNSFKFDRKIHNDAEAQSKYGLGAIDVTANGQSYIYTGSNDMTVRLYSGDLKHWEYVSPYMTFDTKQEKNQGQDQDIGNGIEIADKINTGAGLVNSVHAVGVAGAMKNAGVTNETLSESEEFGKGFKAFKNATRTIGVVTTGVDAGIAAYDFYQHPTTGNFIKLGVKGALFGLEAFELTNPYIGLGISILDATGVTKKGYDWIDHNTLGSAGSIENYNKKQLDGTHLSL
jgi:RHS repeat-associated protein